MKEERIRTEKEIALEAKLIPVAEKYNFEYEICFKGYPAEYETRLIDGKVNTFEVKPSYSREEFCISYFFKNKTVRFTLVTEDDINSFETILEQLILWNQDYIYFENESIIQIPVYEKLNINTANNYVYDYEFILNVDGNKLDILLTQDSSIDLLNRFLIFQNKFNSLSSDSITVLTIKNWISKDEKTFAKRLRQVINSVLFDISKISSTHFFKYSLLDFALDKSRWSFQKQIDIDYPISLTLKEYDDKLLEYFNTYKAVSYSPFNFLALYHILEYHQDSSAYITVNRQLKKILNETDFHQNSAFYTRKAVNLIKNETAKNQSDSIKLKRVLKEFVDKDDLISNLKELNLLDYFKKDVTLKNENDITVQGINPDTDERFYSSLVQRIYSIRCSIVHSNPDFESSRNSPFEVNSENMEILEKEIILLREISIAIIDFNCKN